MTAHTVKLYAVKGSREERRKVLVEVDSVTELSLPLWDTLYPIIVSMALGSSHSSCIAVEFTSEAVKFTGLPGTEG